MRSETAALWAGFRKTVLLIGAIDIIIIMDMKGTYNPVLILTTIIITTIMMVVITTIIFTNNMMMVTIVIIPHSRELIQNSSRPLGFTNFQPCFDK